MPKIKMLRTLGTQAHKKDGIPFNRVDERDVPYQEGQTYDVSQEVADKLFEKKLAEHADSFHAVPQAASLRGVPPEHVSQTDEAEAIKTIGKLKDKEQLQHLVDHDSRANVKEAARKRLAAL
jgi:hypothetical protein